MAGVDTEVRLPAPDSLTTREPDPERRIKLAEELAEDAKRLAGAYFEERRRAIAEFAREVGSNAEAARRLGLSRNAVSDAVNQAITSDRVLFDTALQILIRPRVSGASQTELLRGLAVDQLAAKARRVLYGVKHTHGGVSEEERALLGRAAVRARQVLGEA